MTREEMEKRLHELARKYVETHDQKIIEELYELSRELEKMEKSEKQRGTGFKHSSLFWGMADGYRVVSGV